MSGCLHRAAYFACVLLTAQNPDPTTPTLFRQLCEEQGIRLGAGCLRKTAEVRCVQSMSECSDCVTFRTFIRDRLQRFGRGEVSRSKHIRAAVLAQAELETALVIIDVRHAYRAVANEVTSEPPCSTASIDKLQQAGVAAHVRERLPAKRVEIRENRIVAISSQERSAVVLSS